MSESRILFRPFTLGGLVRSARQKLLQGCSLIYEPKLRHYIRSLHFTS